MSRFQFVADHRDAFEVKWLCTIVEVSRSSYYAWLDGAEARTQRRACDDALAARIQAVHDADRAYGAPRITAELNDGTTAGDQGRVHHKRVARVMRERGIAGLRLRRKVRTTIPEPADEKVPDLLKRDFTAPVPNQRYVGDITYLPYESGHLYLATVIDCCSHRLVGWSIADHMRTELVANALRAAQAERGSLVGAVFHADHGAQFRSRAFVHTLANNGLTGSMGRVRACGDNAAMESFFALPQKNVLNRQHWSTREELGLAIVTWIEKTYHRRRRQRALGRLTPIEFELLHHQLATAA